MSLTDDYYAEVAGVQYMGQFTPRVKWLLTDFDTWERNPYYVNPKPWLCDDSHPEDDYPQPVKLRVIQCNAYRIPRCVDPVDAGDEIPF